MLLTKITSRCSNSLKTLSKFRKFSTNTLFGSQPFTDEEISRLTERLNMMLGDEVVAKRKGPGGVSLSYIEGWKAIEIANKTFGVLDIKTDYLDKNENGFWNCGVTALVRVELKDGCSHEDVGFGEAIGSTRGMVLDKAKKEAVTDAKKRALRHFGNVLGNCLYDPKYLKTLKPAYGSYNHK